MIQKQLLKKIRETITEIQSSSQNLLDQNIHLGGRGQIIRYKDRWKHHR